jgi:P27 family predicted phage terminase small subunit
MKRGPKPQVTGTPTPGPMPDPPEFLDSKALAVWRRYGPPLNALGLLESLDAIAFGMLCDAVVAWESTRDKLDDEQLFQCVGEGGALQQHPLVSIVRQNQKAVREFLTEFGMTPGSRTALTGSTSATPGDGDVDPMEALLGHAMKSAGGVTPPAEQQPSAHTRRTKKKPKPKAAKKKPKGKRKAG